MSKIPKYRRHSTRNKGFVEVSGKRIYFPGQYKSSESLCAYSDLLKSIAGKKDNGLDIRVTRGEDVPICLLVAKFLGWAKTKYIKHGRSTGTYERFRDCITPPLLDLFSDMPVEM